MLRAELHCPLTVKTDLGRTTLYQGRGFSQIGIVIAKAFLWQQRVDLCGHFRNAGKRLFICADIRQAQYTARRMQNHAGASRMANADPAQLCAEHSAVQL